VAADWRLFHNDRRLAAELALGKTPAQARTYAARLLYQGMVLPAGGSEAQAIAALAVLGITDPVLPASARHKAAIVEHLQATGSNDDLPPAPAGASGAGTAADITGSTDITARSGPGRTGGRAKISGPRASGHRRVRWRAVQTGSREVRRRALHQQVVVPTPDVLECRRRVPCNEPDRAGEDLLPVARAGADWLLTASLFYVQLE
jgi:hypothetical protein